MANRVVLGNRGGGQYGLYISKPGFNALTAASIDLLFSSDQKAFQVVQKGEVSIANESYSTITHQDLGYTPIFIVSPRFNNPVGSSDLADSDWWIRRVSYSQTEVYVRTHDFGYAGTCSYTILRKRVDG